MYPRGKIWLKGEWTSCCLSYVMRCTPKWFYMSTREVKNLMGRGKDFLHVNCQWASLANETSGLFSCHARILFQANRSHFAISSTKAFCTGKGYSEWENLAKRLGELHVFHNLERQKLNLPPAVYCPRQSWQRYLRPLSRVIVWGCRPEPETTTRTPPVHRSAMDTFSFSSFI